MKKAFWIGYAVVFLIIVVGGIFVLKGKNAKNVILLNELEKINEDVEAIKEDMAKGSLPNRTGPGVYTQRLNDFKTAESDLKISLNGYNAWTGKILSDSNEEFDGIFVTKWTKVLSSVLANGLVVGDENVNVATLQKEIAEVADMIGIPLFWRIDDNILTPSVIQVKIAQEQYWIQKNIIKHFVKAETESFWENYVFKRKDRDPEAQRNTGNENKSPSLLGIVFGLPSSAAVRRGGRSMGEANRDYITSVGFADNYHFTAEFQIRFSKIPAFMNYLIKDKEFFYVIDSMDITALTEGGDDDKIGREYKKGLIPEKEPPVLLSFSGKVVTFDFTKKVEKQIEGKGASRKKR